MLRLTPTSRRRVQVSTPTSRQQVLNAADDGSDNGKSSTSEHDTAIGVLAALLVLLFGLIGHLTYQLKRASKDPKRFISRPASSSASNSNRTAC